MSRTFSNAKGQVFRSVLTYSVQFSGEDEPSVTERVFGPYTRPNDASAQLTRHAQEIGRRDEVTIIKGRVQQGTVTWQDVASTSPAASEPEVEA